MMFVAGVMRDGDGGCVLNGDEDVDGAGWRQWW